MSDGLWDALEGDEGWADDSLVSEPQPAAWGEKPGAEMPLEAKEEVPAASVEVTRAEVVAELEKEGEQPAQERPRDEKGRFVKQEEPEAPEEPAVEETPQELLLGKFRSADELARAYQELESHVGSVRNELGELRALREELSQVRERVERPSLPSNWDDLLDENPARAAQAALDAGDRDRYDEAKRAWEMESPGAPQLFEQNMMLNYKMAQIEEQLQQQAAPVQEQTEVAATARALAKVKSDHPDFDKFEDAMAQVMRERPLYMSAMKQAVAAADAEAQAAIFSDLYALVADRRSDNLSKAQEEANRAAAEAQLKARQDAVVVSATGTATEPVLSEADLIAAEWDKLDAPYRTGWLEP